MGNELLEYSSLYHDFSQTVIFLCAIDSFIIKAQSEGGYNLED